MGISLGCSASVLAFSVPREPQGSKDGVPMVTTRDLPRYLCLLLIADITCALGKRLAIVEEPFPSANGSPVTRGLVAHHRAFSSFNQISASMRRYWMS